jgi:peptide/nickel transport system permease protein
MMRIYVFKRLLYFIPALFFILLFSFLLMHYSPGDPVDRMLTGQGIYENEISPSEATSDLKVSLRHKFGLDLPLFYFSVNSLWNINLPQTNQSEWKKYIPGIHYNRNNQFDRWLFGDENGFKGILLGDFGTSWVTHQNVSSMIFSRLKWSLFFTIISVVLAYLISVPVALKSAANPGSLFDKIVSLKTTFLISLPSFWIATLLLFTFCNPDVLNIFPSSGVGPVEGFHENTSVLNKIIHSLPYLILPTVCYTYGSLAFLIRSISTSVTSIMKEDYIRTARAKGLEEKIIIRRHAFRNALLPLITIFSNIFPFAIGGSVILETIFTIPGIGLLVYQSIGAQDYPVIIAVFMITGLVTMLSFLITDILYAFADPRISFTRKQSR